MTEAVTYVALLRGINVGGHQKVPMAQLRALLTGLGYRDVRTLLQSGNVVFRSPPTAPAVLERAITDAIAASLGLTVAVLVRTGEELAAVVAANTLPTHEPARFLVLFLAAPVPPPELDLPAYAPEQVQFADREVYLYCANGILESGLAKVLTDRRLGTAVTARNWNTVTKLLALADG